MTLVQLSLNMKVVIVGASGSIGGAILRQASRCDDITSIVTVTLAVLPRCTEKNEGPIADEDT